MLRQQNIKKVAARVGKIMACSDNSVYVLLDGDRTLIPNDSTRIFLRSLNIDYADIKNIFVRQGYSFDAFYNAATYYSEIETEQYNRACVESATHANIYPEFLSFIDIIKHHVDIIIVTCGISQIWRNVIKKHSLDFVHLIGGNHLLADEFVVDKHAKGVVASAIKKENGKIFAFGDSTVDFDMLKAADNAYLLVNEKQNNDFIPFANQISHLEQISFSGYFHPNIPSTNLEKIKEKILGAL